MVDPVGAGMGAASLLIQLLDTAAAGYGLFIAAGSMDATCLELRTKLEMEQCRLLDFAEVVGLLDYKERDSLPEVLQPQKLVVIAIFTQISCKLEEFSALTNRYKQLRPNETPKEVDDKLKSNLTETYVTLKFKWTENVKKSEKRREHLRGTNHLFKWFEMSKDIATEPKRLWWAAFDEKVFRKILHELVEYNNYLHELMHGHHARRLEETTRKTFMEMVLVRGEIEDLKNLIVNSILTSEHKQIELTPRAAEANSEHQKLLEVLVDTKTRNINNDRPEEQKPPAYREIVKATKLEYKSIILTAEVPKNKVTTERVRTSATHTSGDGKSSEVWIEWKPYHREPDPETRSFVARPENVKRVKELVALLQSSSLKLFRVPHCLGFYDYRDDEQDSPHQPLFGLVFRKPDQALGSSAPTSLRELLVQDNCPSLSERVVLAHMIADSLLYMNAVGWFHKAFRSDSIIFSHKSNKADTNLREPYVTGFEYARPDRKDEHSTHVPSDLKYDAYVHPNYQGEHTAVTYRRSFDIYSLGIVLIEIAYWSPILKIMKQEFSIPEQPNRDEVAAIKSKLLCNDTTYLPKLKGMVGDRYHTAVYHCIKGLTDEIDERKIKVSLRLQKDFAEKVVENLGAVEV